MSPLPESDEFDWVAHVYGRITAALGAGPAAEDLTVRALSRDPDALPAWFHRLQDTGRRADALAVLTLVTDRAQRPHGPGSQRVERDPDD